jgi:2-oxoisovalerate dehydrogenase E2 component (dihydrolipoyl transacylase)
MGRYLFKLPDVGEGTAEAEIVAWHVKLGDVVDEDQPLVDVMTDKATVEITSPVAGKIASLRGEPGAMAPVGSVLVELEVEGTGNAGEAAPDPAPVAAAAPPKPAPAPKPEPVKAPAPVAAPAPMAQASEPRPANSRPLASPALRQRALDQGVDLRQVIGTGPGGRIMDDDLEAHVRRAQTPAAGGPALRPLNGVSEVKIIGLRRKIAEKMAEAKRHIPHITYVEEIDVTELEALRQHLNATKRIERPKLTLLPFFIRALVKVLPEHPQINARYDDDEGVLSQYEGVHVGIATQAPGGLMVPVVRHAEALSIWDCAKEIGRVTQAARDGSATREELTGSTITLTSLGTLGGVVHTPVINWPEVAIVGPNKIMERPVVQNGQVVVRKMMNLSSSFDHRIIDGWDAASFVQKIKGLLEHPASLFVDF